MGMDSDFAVLHLWKKTGGLAVMNYSLDLMGHTLEYFEEHHTYVVDGVILPSITQILNVRFEKKYKNVDKLTLRRASQAGTAVHEAIQRLCEDGEVSDLPEIRNFMFLQRKYEFQVLECETPVILSRDAEPIAVGRLDLVLRLGDSIGGADIKRTSTLDKEYLAYQLNLYRIAYRQSYGVEWSFLKGIHLRNDVRRFVDIPINEDIAWQIVDEYMEKHNDKQVLGRIVHTEG